MPVRHRPIPRRAALKALAVPLLAPMAINACGGRSKGTVRVAVGWSGYELSAFRDVLAGFSRERDWDVTVLPIGDDIIAVLGAQVAQTSTPDVVLLSRAALVHDYRDRLVELDGEVTGNFPDRWEKLVTTSDGAVRGIWYKTAHKSMVWYRPDLFEQVGIGEPPTTWDAFKDTNETLAEAGVTPLALGAADGWVLTDWFENILLGVDPQVYQSLARTGHGWGNPVVATALRLLGDAWSLPGAFPGGVNRALLTQFEESVVDVCHRNRAAMVVEGDFVYPVILRYAASDVRMDWFTFPELPTGLRPVVAGGDIAVLPEPGTRGGRELIEYLAQARAAQTWARKGGFISVHNDVPVDGVYPSTYTQTLVNEVREGVHDQIAFDLSDQLTGRLGGAEGRGLWLVLQDFLAGVAEGDITAAVEQTVQTLVDLAEARDD